MYDLIDAALRNTEINTQSVLADTHRLEELLEKEERMFV
jgi:hypothetical protein